MQCIASHAHVKVSPKALPAWAAQAEHRASSAGELLEQFANRSSTHGMKRLFNRKLGVRLRILWLLALLAALAMLVYVCRLLAQRYQRKQFQTVIANATASIDQIPFPVIVICNKNRLNWATLPAMRQHHNISTAEDAQLFERILTAYDGLSFGTFDFFDSLRTEQLQSLNHLNFTNIVQDMSWRCNELLDDCIWRTHRFNCCALFQPRRLPYGACLAFNEDKMRYVAQAGVDSALSVTLRLQRAQHAPGNTAAKGFLVSIFEPYVWFSSPIEVEPHRRTDIALSAMLHYFDDNMRSLSPELRECVFENERNSRVYHTLQGTKYMQENCVAECQQRYLQEFCNCSVDLFYPPGGIRACQLMDMPCLAAHNHLIQYYIRQGEAKFVHHPVPGMVCYCLNNCHSLAYEPEVRKDKMRRFEKSKRLQDGTLRVYYKQPEMLVYKTTLIQTWVDLLVCFGGIFALCLGCSIISFIEFCYFGCIDVPQFIWRRNWLRSPLSRLMRPQHEETQF